jgi:dihydrofolate reductase
MTQTKVFFDLVSSLDGFIAPAGMDMAHADDPEYMHWRQRWMGLMHWVFPQRFFRENLKLGEGGETGRDNQLLQETFERTGVVNDGIESALAQARRVAGGKDIRIAGGANVVQLRNGRARHL